MNRRIQFILLLLASVALNVSAQGTAFNYQGRLSDAGAPGNGSYDFRFIVFNALTNGNQVSVPLTNSAVVVTNGLFNVTLDFGAGIFTGTNYWLDLAVRATGATNFTTLFPRQPVLPVPYAIFATGASNLLGTLSATQLVGTLASAQISGTYSGQVNFANGANIFSGTFNGNGPTLSNLNASQLITGTVADSRLTANVALLNQNQTFTGSNNFYGGNNFTNGANNFAGNFSGTFSGSGPTLSNLNASQLTAGTVADSRLSANVALLNASQTFTGGNNFTNRANNFTGSFFGNGLVGWIPVSGTFTQATVDAGYLLTNSGQTTVLLPPAAQLTVGDIVRISGAGAGGWLVAENSGQSILGNFASYRNCFLQLGSTGTGTDWRRICSSADGTRMYAGGNFSGGVYLSTDYGQTWNGTGISGSGWFSVACSADGSKIYAAPNGGLIQTSSNGGLSWASFGSIANWTAIACSADATKYIAGASSGALTGSIASSPASGNWVAVACSANGTNIAAAIGSKVYTSTNGGGAWINSTLPGACSALAAASGFKLVAAYNGGISTSTNFGLNWTTSGAGTGAWSCLAGSSDCTRLVAGVSNGLFYASANFGASWTSLSSTNQNWSGAGISADGSKFAAAVRDIGSVTGGIYFSGASAQPNSGTTNSIFGSQGSAVELQYIGNNQFMPVSAVGTLWAN